MFKNINGTKTNINPTVTEQGTYQKHGLRPIDRKPNDYLRMVARTFSSFRNTSTNDTVVSYINGFEISHNDATVTETIDWLPADVSYDIFKVNKGICMIDNQLIDIYEDGIFYFNKSGDAELGGLLYNTKYAVVVEYDYIEQYDDQSAIIRFIPYQDLTFPRLDDQNVVSCKYTDQSLDGLLNVTDLSGKPGLLIATFKVDDIGNIVHSTQEQGGEVLPGIDPQFLSKLYIQNYKLLFEYFGDQARSIFSSMGMTQATFISIDRTKLHPDLKSGDMCYLNEETMQYCKSIASRQKFSKVVGLYLNEYQEDNHLIYINGVINVDEIKHNLPSNHTLLTLQPGRHYFLEDDCSLFDTNHPTMTIDNYTLSDSSGRISPRFYPASVRVGYATACNQLFLNIDHSLEIGANNLLGLFGNFEEYKTEYNANNISIDRASEIENADNKIQIIRDRIDVLQNAIGQDNYAEILTWCTTLNSENFNFLMYDAIVAYFKNGTNVKSIIDVTYTPPTSLFNKFTTIEKTSITAGLDKYSYLKDISNIIKIQLTKFEQLKTIKVAANLSFYQTNYTNLSLALINKLKIARLTIQDNPDIEENFENKDIDIGIDTTTYNYSSNISILNDNNTDLINSNNNRISTFSTNQNKINEITVIIAELTQYLINIETLLLYCNSKISDYNITIDEFLANTVIWNNEKIEAESRIITSPALRLDIFLMDEYQRNVFNYTYITDRLRRRLFLIDQYKNDLDRAALTYETLISTAETTIVQKVAAQQEVARIENMIAVNEAMIEEYTIEYNRLRKDVFAIDPIIKYDREFSDGGFADQRIGTYRYGCDPDDAYNGLGTNFISVSAGNAFIKIDTYASATLDTTPYFSGTSSEITSDLRIEVGTQTLTTTIDADGTWGIIVGTLPIGHHIMRVIGYNIDGLEYVVTASFSVATEL